MKYLVAIKVVAEDGNVTEGSIEASIDTLTAKALRNVSDEYCAALRRRGVICSDEKALVYSAIRLEA